MPPRSTTDDQARPAEMALPRYQRGDFQREAPLTKSPKGASKPLPPRRQPPLLASRREMLKPRQAWRRVQRWGPRLRRKNWRHRRGNFRRGWSYGPESLPGLEVMCLMFAAFQRVAPQEDIGIDLHDAY